MKNYIFTCFILFFVSFTLHAQTEERKETSNFSLGLNFSLGNSILNSEEFKDLNGSVSGARLNLIYDFKNESFVSWRIGLGVETATYNANLFSSIGQASLQSDYLRIPLEFSAVYRLGKNENSVLSNTKFVAGVGGFLNYVYNYEVSNIENSTDLEDVDLGFGYLFSLGLEQEVSQKFTAVLCFDSSLMGDENDKDKLKFNNNVFNLGLRYSL